VSTKIIAKVCIKRILKTLKGVAGVEDTGFAIVLWLLRFW